MAKKSATTKKPAKEKKEVEKPDIEEEKGLRAKQELFCMYFSQDQQCFDNATKAYAAAYGYELDTLSRERKTVTEGGKRKKEKESEYARAVNVCGVEGKRLLRNPKIRLRCRELLNELLQDTIVDAQLSRIIMQDKRPEVKMQGIKEYNRLKKRIDDVPPAEPIKVDITLQLGKVYG